jgi:beta-lactamase class A
MITIRIDELERRAGSSAAFEKALAVTGMTRDRLRRQIRDDLRIVTYLNQRFGATTAPADRETAIAAWTSELRRRAEITVPYQGKQRP